VAQEQDEEEDRRLMHAYANYFADDPLHDDVTFWRCFRIRRKLFLKIVEELREFGDYFKLKRDIVGTLGFSTI
jgi:hypothetical protein